MIICFTENSRSSKADRQIGLYCLFIQPDEGCVLGRGGWGELGTDSFPRTTKLG